MLPLCSRRAWTAAPSETRGERPVDALVDQVRHAPACRRRSCTTPPLVATAISRSGRRTTSSTSRSGLVNPALVQFELPPDRLPARPRRRRRRAPAPAQRAQHAPVSPHQHDRDPDASAATPCPAAQARRGADDARGPRARARERRQHSPGTTPSTTQATREEHDRAAHRHPAAPAPRRRLGAAARPSSDQPDHLHEAEHRERRGRRERGERDRPGQSRADAAVRRDVQQRLERQPLRREPVQRRQPGDRHRADQKRAPRPRHPPQQTAEPVELERANRPLERPGAQEQQRLEDGVVQRVQQRRGERDRRPQHRAPRHAAPGSAEAEQDDPDVLDRVKRKQPLQLVLEQRVHHPADRRQRAEREHEDADPERAACRPSRTAPGSARRSRP